MSTFYVKGICHSSLVNSLSAQNCEVNRSHALLVAANNEAMARTKIANLHQLNISLECSDKLTAFLCFSLFGLCGDNKELVQPIMKQCEDTKYRTCSEEWKLAITSGLDLPDCTELPMDQNISCQNVIMKEGVCIHKNQNNTSILVVSFVHLKLFVSKSG